MRHDRWRHWREESFVLADPIFSRFLCDLRGATRFFAMLAPADGFKAAFITTTAAATTTAAIINSATPVATTLLQQYYQYYLCYYYYSVSYTHLTLPTIVRV